TRNDGLAIRKDDGRACDRRGLMFDRDRQSRSPRRVLICLLVLPHEHAQFGRTHPAPYISTARREEWLPVAETRCSPGARKVRSTSFSGIPMLRASRLELMVEGRRWQRAAVGPVQ